MMWPMNFAAHQLLPLCMHKRSFSVKFFTFAAGLLISGFCLMSSAAAQTGGLKGRVKNLEGNGISGATVTARLNGKDLRTVTSDKKGEFLMDGLDAGVYNVVVDANGYSSGIKPGIEVAAGKIRDLGDRLILTADRGSFVIIDGGVFYKDGTRLSGAEVKIERVNADGSTRKLSTLWSNDDGDFAFRQRPGTAKLRVTATYNGRSATKDVDVDNAALYHVALSLDVERAKPE
jgi:hypothetical protein